LADRPRDDWWLASDDKWYPPDLRPDVGITEPETWVPHSHRTSGTTVPRTLTKLLVWALLATSIFLVVAAFFGLRHAATVRSATSTPGSIETAEFVALGWSGIAVLGILVSGLLVIVWTFQTSKSLDARGTTGRRWRGGWTIGSWFIPIASLVLPKLVFNELERVVQVPYTGQPIGETWKTMSRSQLGDVWWLLWVAALIPLQIVQVLAADQIDDGGTIAMVATVTAISYALFAGAGVALAFVIRRIEQASRS